MESRSLGMVTTISLVLGLLVSACAAPAASPTSVAKPTASSGQVAATAPPAAPPTAAPAAGTGQAATPAPVATSPAAKPAGELRVVAGTIGVQTLDPMQENGPGKVYQSLLYTSVVNMTSEGQITREKGLATDWAASPDKKTWTFTLRKGVKFHNGDELTSQDVKFSAERNIGAQSKTPLAGFFRNLIDRIDTPNPNTVVYNLKQPNGMFDYWVSFFVTPDSFVVPKKYIEEKGEEYFRTHPVGSGPYRFVEQKQGFSITIEAVDSHWSGIVPKFKTITFSAVPEEATRIAMLKRGQADIIDSSRAKVKDITLSGLKIYASTPDTLVGAFLEKQWDTTTYLSDKRVREALNLAVNRQEMQQTLFMGQGNVSNTFFYGTNNMGYEPVAPYPYDPTRAKQLIAEAFPNGISLTMVTVPRPGVSELGLVNEAVAGYWDKIGVKIKMVAMEMGAWQDAKRSNSMANSVTGFTVINQPLPSGTMSALLDSKAALATVKDSEMDKLVAAAAQALDVQQVGQAHRALGKYIRDNNLAVGIVEVGTVYGAAANLPKWNPGKIQYMLNLAEGFN